MTANSLFVDLRGRGALRAGSYEYTGDGPDAAWHHHDLHQIQYACAGFAEVESHGSYHLLPPQQAAWIPAGVTHRTTLRHVRAVAVFFPPDMFPAASGRVRVLAVTPLLRELILHSTRWPIERVTDDVEADDDVAEACFEALARLAEHALDHEAPLALPTSDDPLVRAAMDATLSDLARATPASVCREAGLSERSLRRRFAAVAGMTWGEYALQARVLRSMALLSDGRLPVAQVAHEVGFGSVSAFTRAFRRLTGETPAQYGSRIRAQSRA